MPNPGAGSACIAGHVVPMLRPPTPPLLLLVTTPLRCCLVCRLDFTPSTSGIKASGMEAAPLRRTLLQIPKKVSVPVTLPYKVTILRTFQSSGLHTRHPLLFPRI
jgi:hypothetical protein